MRGGGDADGKTLAVVGSDRAHNVLVGVGGGVMSFVNDEALGSKTVEA